MRHRATREIGLKAVLCWFAFAAEALSCPPTDRPNKMYPIVCMCSSKPVMKVVWAWWSPSAPKVTSPLSWFSRYQHHTGAHHRCGSYCWSLGQPFCDDNRSQGKLWFRLSRCIVIRWFNILIVYGLPPVGTMLWCLHTRFIQFAAVVELNRLSQGVSHSVMVFYVSGGSCLFKMHSLWILP